MGQSEFQVGDGRSRDGLPPRLAPCALRLASFPIPTYRMALLVLLGTVTALVWGWAGALWVDAGILILLGADWILTLGARGLQGRRLCPAHLHQGMSQEVQILMRNERWIQTAEGSGF